MGFTTILADPPVNERGAGKYKRGANRHYPLLKTRDIAPTILNSGLWFPAENAHLWIWATNNHLEAALQVIRELGFTYKTNAVWIKTNESSFSLDEYEPDDFHADPPKLQIGLGQYLRGSHELLLFATRGKGQDDSVWNAARNIPSAFFAPRTRHSKKPEASYDLIESISKGPSRLELFARSGRPGWISWGNELDKTEGEEE